MSKKPIETAHNSAVSGIPDIEPPIRIELRTSGGARRSLAEDLELSVQITNISGEPVWMVGVVPGSDGLRYPQYVAEIEGPEGSEQTRLPEDLDYVRGLRAEDFVRLAPGQSFDPQGKDFIPIQQLAWFKPTKHGTYQFRLRFDATEPDPRQWMGHTRITDPRSIERMIQRVPPVRVWSNTLEIEYW